MRYLYYICAIILSLTSCVDKIAPTTGTIFGVVKDAETAQPLVGCNVVLMPTGESTVTGSDGTFHFDDVFPDNYSVEINCYNYYSNKKSVIITSGNTTAVDVLLTKYDPNNRLAELGAMNVSEVTYNSVRALSEVIEQGSSSVTERGFLYSELPNITIATATKVVVASGVGTFSTTIKGLAEKTTYYIAPYAINGRGTAYGDAVQFKTGDASVIPLPSNVIFVSILGNDSNDGSSWNKAKKTIKAAFDIAIDGKQIWVSAGSFDEKIIPKSGINIYGGFSGTEINIDQRKDKSTVTGASCSAFTVETKIDGFIFKDGSAYNALVSLGNYVVLENCIITEFNDAEYDIAAINTHGKEVVIKNCIFENNKNMVIKTSSGTLTIINIHFRGNSSYCIWNGGDNFGVKNIVVYNCVFTNNSSVVYNKQDGIVNLYNCTIANNKSVYSSGYTTTLNLYNCLLWNNESFRDEGVNRHKCIEVLTANNSAVKLKKPSIEIGSEATDWQTADWSITAGSSCINAGNNIYFPIDDIPTDIAGNSRVTGTTIDIGAYEY